MRKVYKLTVMVIDHDDIGAQAVAEQIQHANYANDCINPEVAAVEVREVEWGDGHPLNSQVKWTAACAELCGKAGRHG